MDPLSRREFLGTTALSLAAGGFPTTGNSPATPEWNLLGPAFPPEKLAAMLLPRSEWKPFATASERAPWEGLPREDRESLIADGVRSLKTGWPTLPASLFLEYARIGNRSNYEGVRNQRRDKLRELAIAECVEAKGRFTDEIVNGIWTTCEESYWGVPAHLNLQKAGSGLPDVAEPTVDLFTGETSSLLSWIDYLLGPQLESVSPLIRPRIRLEIDRRVLTPNLTRNFGWMGFQENPNRPVRPPNNWNPWINSNWLASALLIEKDEKRRVASVHKILLSLDKFLNGYAADGGCDEGPGYWGRAGASLFDCLELLYSATGGKLDIYGAPLVGEIGRYIYRAQIHDRYFTNFADAPAIVRPSADLLYRYGLRIRDEKLSGLGSYFAKQGGASPRGDSILRQLPAIFNAAALRAAPASQPLVRDTWLPGIQVMMARQKEGSASGLYLAAQGGHNAESHNHNDVGNFMVYADGRPVIIDIGVETYSAKTFSSKRYEIWTMQSAYHNLPTIDGIMQKEGIEFAASQVEYKSSENAAQLALDISKAYPTEAGLNYWTRTLQLDRAANQVELTDHYGIRRKPNEIMWTFMTPCKVQEISAGVIQFGNDEFSSGTVRLAFDGKSLTPSIEEIEVKDSRLRSSWGDRLYRILLKARNPAPEATFEFRMVQK